MVTDIAPLGHLVAVHDITTMSYNLLHAMVWICMPKSPECHFPMATIMQQPSTLNVAYARHGKKGASKAQHARLNMTV